MVSLPDVFDSVRLGVEWIGCGLGGFGGAESVAHCDSAEIYLQAKAVDGVLVRSARSRIWVVMVDLI